ncbi:MAG: YdcH family protein [Desulfuromonadaceae bacterium]|nr:YdcH family protein [Desulfuromonadaceae bacterium]
MDVSPEVVTHLFETDARFRKLYEEHRILEKQLDQLNGISFLSADQELERKKIQKMKLSGKDEMEKMIKQVNA